MRRLPKHPFSRSMVPRFKSIETEREFDDLQTSRHRTASTRSAIIWYMCNLLIFISLFFVFNLGFWKDWIDVLCFCNFVILDRLVFLSLHLLRPNPLNPHPCPARILPFLCGWRVRFSQPTGVRGEAKKGENRPLPHAHP